MNNEKGYKEMYHKATWRTPGKIGVSGFKNHEDLVKNRGHFGRVLEYSGKASRITLAIHYPLNAFQQTP